MSVALFAIEAGSTSVEHCEGYSIAVHTGQPHRLWEWRDGKAREGAHRRGDVVVSAWGDSQRLRWNRPTALLSARLSPSFVKSVAESLEVEVEIVGSFSHRDPILEHLGLSLLRELESNLESGPLFGESVAAAMAVRLLRGYSRRGSIAPRDPHDGLSPSVLSRVLAFIHDDLAASRSLAEMASTAGMSTYHFARQFRRSTGLPPHAYLSRARVEEAVRLIEGGSKPSEAATKVGFSSQGHLTRHTRRILGIAPGSIQVAAASRSAFRSKGLRR